MHKINKESLELTIARRDRNIKPMAYSFSFRNKMIGCKRVQLSKLLEFNLYGSVFYTNIK